jgi:hypothetical protein
MEVFHNEHRTRDIGDILTVLFGLALFRLKNRKVSLQKINANKTNVVFERDATMAERRRRSKEQRSAEEYWEESVHSLSQFISVMVQRVGRLAAGLTYQAMVEPS